MREKKRLFVNMIVVAVGMLGIALLFQVINQRPAGEFWPSFTVLSVIAVVIVTASGIRYFRSRNH